MNSDPSNRSFRKRVAGGLVAMAAVLSLVTLSANPRVEDPIETGTETPEIVVDRNDGVVEQVRLRVTCDVSGVCSVPDPASNTPIEICPGSCEDFNPESEDSRSLPGGVSETDFEIIRGIEREGEFTRLIEEVLEPDALPDDDFIAIELVDGEVRFEEVGDSGIDMGEILRSEPGATTRGVDGLENSSPARNVFAAIGALVLAVVGVGLTLAFLVGLGLLIRFLTDESLTRRARPDPAKDEEEALELEPPITVEVAEERAAVVRDLLDSVRSISDPRHSIQTGFAMLESGFGRSTLIRRRNETASRYVHRILGANDALREPLSEIVVLFERARYSDLVVDESMRRTMIEKLEHVQADWERRAFELSQQAPAAPTAVSIVDGQDENDAPSGTVNR